MEEVVNKCMHWADLTYDQKIEIYKEIFKGKIELPRDPDLAIFEMMVRAHILQCDFTKRQLVILDFIMTLSFAFQKREAYIPLLKDFEMAGISSRIIKDELKKLIAMNVIKWDKELKMFSIEDPRKWDAPSNSGFNPDRSRALFYLNMEHAEIDIQPLLKKKKS